MISEFIHQKAQATHAAVYIRTRARMVAGDLQKIKRKTMGQDAVLRARFLERDLMVRFRKLLKIIQVVSHGIVIVLGQPVLEEMQDDRDWPWSSFAFYSKRQPGLVPMDPVRWNANAQRPQSPASNEAGDRAPSKPSRDKGSATRPRTN